MKKIKKKICKYCGKEMRFFHSSQVWDCFAWFEDSDGCGYMEDTEGKEIHVPKKFKENHKNEKEKNNKPKN